MFLIQLADIVEGPGAYFIGAEGFEGGNGAAEADYDATTGLHTTIVVVLVWWWW